MPRWLKNLSIRNKLMVVTSLLTFVTLLLAATGFVAYQVYTLREQREKTLEVVAKILGANSVAPLLFDDATAATETLQALQGKPQILSAALYNQEGRIFAVFIRDDPSGTIQIPPTPGSGYHAGGGHLELFQKILHEGQAIGTIYLRSATRDFTTHLLKSMLIAILALPIAFGIVFLMATKLQRIISAPLIRLAEAAAGVAQFHDYSRRVSRESEDELGRLIDAFNEMLGQIQARDEELREARVRLEERVKQRTVELDRSNKELEQFAYVASHDLQEPLRKILAFGERLKDQSHAHLDPTSLDYLGRMQGAAKRMQELIDALLQYSRVASQVGRFEPVSLKTLAQEVISDLETRITECRGEVKVGKLPEVYGEPVQLRQLLQNLILNGLKFHPPELAPIVSLEGNDLGDGTAELRVKDNGIGFEERFLDRIFRPFQRLHTREEFEGTGMGLAICQKIVERHNGSIIARSVPGSGATFIVVLPTRQS